MSVKQNPSEPHCSCEAFRSSLHDGGDETARTAARSRSQGRLAGAVGGWGSRPHRGGRRLQIIRDLTGLTKRAAQVARGRGESTFPQECELSSRDPHRVSTHTHAPGASTTWQGGPTSSAYSSGRLATFPTLRDPRTTADPPRQPPAPPRGPPRPGPRPPERTL